MNAAERGVEVHVVLDAFGSALMPKQWLERWEQAGIRFRFYNPSPNIFRFGSQILQRLHRKIVVVDGRIALIGGINISKDQIETSDEGSRLDFAAAVEGPLVSVIHLQCLNFHRRLEHQWFGFYKNLRHPQGLGSGNSAGDAKAKYILRDNFKHRRNIEKAYWTAMENAKSEIILANAYFFPGTRFLRKIKQASRRGVKISLILQGRSEYLLMKWATEGLYRSLLKWNVELYEYQPRFLHAKVAVCDESWSTIGSCNLDPFSLYGNLEANIVVSDSKFSAELYTQLSKCIAEDCKRVLKYEMNFFRRILVKVSFWLFRFLPKILRGVHRSASSMTITRRQEAPVINQ